MKNRYDFVYLIDCKDANPNGDPDAGNHPRTDIETGHGLVTDVCIKRKIRNYIALTRKGGKGHRIYFIDGGILNSFHEEAYREVGFEKSKSPNETARNWMCQNYYDIRTFGAVMSTGDFNCGQVRGPVQLSFARSIDPIVANEHTIIRSSVTNVRDAEKERTIGRKFTVPYGLYKLHGFVNPYLAEQTGFNDQDLELLFQSLENAFQFDQSAARPPGSMNPRALFIFKHDSQLGSAPSHTLFDLVQISKKDNIICPRSFADYNLRVDEAKIPRGVSLISRLA